MRLIQIHNLYDRAGRRRKLIIRFSALCLGAFFLAQVIPTLAEEQSSVVELQQEIAPDATPSESPAESGLGSDTPTDQVTESPSPTPTPAQALENQTMLIKFPTQIYVDPRALVTKLPRVHISGPEYLLVCANSYGAILDVVGKGSMDDQKASNLYLDGDISSNFVMSGPTTLIDSAFNSFDGLKISGLGRKLTSTQVHFSFIAVDKMTEDGKLCGSASPANMRMLNFRPIGLGLGLKKGEISLEQ